MTTARNQNKERLTEIVSAAESLANTVVDPELKKVAFELLLQHLLTGADNMVGKSTDIGKVSRMDSARPSTSGQTFWLMELVGEGYFEKPKPTQQILEALAERGHQLRSSDITWSLAELTKKKVLRRQRQTPDEGGRPVWFYSNCEPLTPSDESVPEKP